LKIGHVTPSRPRVANLRAKFPFPRYGGGPKISQSRSLDPFTTPFDLILHFFSLGPPAANLFAEFEVSTFNQSLDMEGSQNSKSISHDPFMTRFDLILHFSLGPPAAKRVPSPKPIPEVDFRLYGRHLEKLI